MEEKTENLLLTKNTLFALLMGGCFIVTSFMFFKVSGNIFPNPALSQAITLLYACGLTMQIHKFREEHLKGFISYGKALLTGLYLACIAGIMYAVYIFFLYSLNPETLNNYIITVATAFKEVYPNSQIGKDMQTIMETFTTPFSIAISEFFAMLFHGLLYTLLIAAFLKKNKK